MAATASVGLSLSVTGLGLGTHTLPVNFSGTTPTAVTHQYRALAAGASEALPLGDISTVEGVLIYAAVCGDGAIEVDCDYSAAFDADLTIAEGKGQYFKPAGTVHVKNTDDVAGAYEYIAFGTV